MKHDEFDDEIEGIADEIARRQRSFDEVNELSRSIIRGCAKAITLLHNGDTAAARAAIGESERLAAGLGKADPEFRYMSLQAYQELAEAVILCSVKLSRRIPWPSEVRVPRDAYLLGLMDVVGELKRGMLISLMGGDRDTAGLYFRLMERIYDSTRSLRFAESVLPAFRRKQDVARIQLEAAGSDMLKFLKGGAARAGRQRKAGSKMG